MHHIFRIDEIVVQVVRSILPTTSSITPCTPSYNDIEASSKVALLALALSCKTLLEPALDGLWHTQTSLVPLLRCLLDAIVERRVSQDEKDPTLPMTLVLVRHFRLSRVIQTQTEFP